MSKTICRYTVNVSVTRAVYLMISCVRRGWRDGKTHQSPAVLFIRSPRRHHHHHTIAHRTYHSAAAEQLLRACLSLFCLFSSHPTCMRADYSTIHNTLALFYIRIYRPRAIDLYICIFINAVFVRARHEEAPRCSARNNYYYPPPRCTLNL